MFEELLKALKDLTAALRENTASGGAAPKATKTAKAKPETAEAPAAPASTPEPPATPAPEEKSSEPAIDLPVLTGIAQAILDLGGLPRVKELNGKIGIERISKCPPEKFAELHAALVALRDELAKEKAAV